MTMFIEDFERTENSDEVFAIVGRALVIATRFDSMCKALARSADLKLHALYEKISDDDFDDFTEQIIKKYSTLDKSINRMRLPDDLSTTLHDARRARNEIAHDLAIGMEGCLDTKLNMQEFLGNLSACIKHLALGDALISVLLRQFNGGESTHPELVNAYVNRISHWVIDR